MARAAYRRMPRQRLIDIVLNKQPHIKAVAAIFYQLAIGANVVDIAYQTDLEIHHRIDAFLAFLAVILLGGFVQKVQIERSRKPAEKVVCWYKAVQMYLVHHFGLDVFLSLHA